MAAYDDLNVKRIAVISVISILVTAVTVLAVQVLYFAMADIVDGRKVQSASYTRQNAVLVDPDTGNVTIPVEDAMKKLVKEAHSHDEA